MIPYNRVMDRVHIRKNLRDVRARYHAARRDGRVWDLQALAYRYRDWMHEWRNFKQAQVDS